MNIAGELPGAFGVGLEPGGKCEAELPALGDGVEARGDDVEVRWPVIARARVALRRTGALEVEPGVTVPIAIPEHVLALDRQLPIASQADAEVWAVTLETGTGSVRGAARPSSRT